MRQTTLVVLGVVLLATVISAFQDNLLFPSYQIRPHHLERRAEARDFYPCKRCFTIRKNKVTCTTPRCPENYGCDDYSFRCFRVANLTNVRQDDDDNRK